MDVVNPFKNSLIILNEVSRTEKPYNACRPIVILIVNGPRNGVRGCQKEVGDCCKYLNTKYSSNPSSHRVVTSSDTNDPNLEG